MSIEFEKLLTVLLAESDIYTQLLALSKDKKEAVLNNDLDQINRVVREEQALVARLSDKERLRLASVRELTAKLGDPEATLMSFAALGTPQQQARLDDLQIALRGVLSELQAANEVNKRLIDTRLDYIRFVVDSMSEGGGAGVYGALGEGPSHSGQRTNLYDQKV